MFDDWVCLGITHVHYTGSSGADTFNAKGDFTIEVRAGEGDDEALIDEVGSAALYGEGGNDYLNAYSRPDGAGHHLDGGDGNDEVHGGDKDDTVLGGPGDDRVSGGWGNDVVRGDSGADIVIGDHPTGVANVEDGDDIVEGGEGDDELQGLGGADVFRGGDGSDSVRYDLQYQDGGVDSFAITLDGAANDGGNGEGDNVDADGGVENVVLPLSGVQDLTYVGNDGPNQLTAGASGTVTVDGRGGDDSLAVHGGATATVLGGAGHDSLSVHAAVSNVDGGPGNDVISSTAATRANVVGGSGADSISTGNGDDVIDSADGEVDTVSCGNGADRLTGDRIDNVAVSAQSVCEQTELVGTGPGDTADTGELTVKIPKRSRVRKGAVRYKVTSGLPEAVTLAGVAKNAGNGKTLGKGRVTVASGTTATLRIKLTTAARRYLAKHGKVKAKIIVRAVEGATGKVTRKTRIVG